MSISHKASKCITIVSVNFHNMDGLAQACWCTGVSCANHPYYVLTTASGYISQILSHFYCNAMSTFARPTHWYLWKGLIIIDWSLFSASMSYPQNIYSGGHSMWYTHPAGCWPNDQWGWYTDTGVLESRLLCLPKHAKHQLPWHKINN